MHTVKMYTQYVTIEGTKDPITLEEGVAALGMTIHSLVPWQATHVLGDFLAERFGLPAESVHRALWAWGNQVATDEIIRMSEQRLYGPRKGGDNNKVST